MSPGKRSNDSYNTAFPTLSETRYSQSLERGLAILGCFSADEPWLGIADIAGKLGMSRSTTHRYVITLVRLGYLEQIVTGRKYRLGLRVTDLGLSALDMLIVRTRGRPHLEALRKRVSYTVNAAVLQDDCVFIVDRLCGFKGYVELLPLKIGLASKLPAHCTSLGKLLLAYLGVDERKEIVRSLTLRRAGPNTITKRRELLNELDRISETGFALNDQELAAGIQSIAMPVRLGQDVIAAIDVTTSISVVKRDELMGAVLASLTETTQALSMELSGDYNKDKLVGTPA